MGILLYCEEHATVSKTKKKGRFAPPFPLALAGLALFLHVGN